jgi:hypothetical protein
MRWSSWLGLLLAACSSEVVIPDGGILCDVDPECPALQCDCPVAYQACLNGVCATTCPQPFASTTSQPCAYDCECQSDLCSVDTGQCCPSTGAQESGSLCQQDCDCISVICSTGVCQ